MSTTQIIVYFSCVMIGLVTAMIATLIHPLFAAAIGAGIGFFCCGLGEALGESKKRRLR